MSTAGAQFPYRGSEGTTAGTRDKAIAWTIFSVCVLTFVLALLFLSGTDLGFALAFGSGLVAYECVLVIRRIAARTAADSDRHVSV